MKSFSITGKVWRYEGPAGWYFVYVDKALSLKLRKTRGRRVGWGYLPLEARIGKTRWKTTLFPTKEGPYLLSIKADVRQKEAVGEGDVVKVHCTLL